MRRFPIALMILLAFTGVGCPPAPPVDATKKDAPNPVESIPKPPETPDDVKVRIDAALEQVRSRDLLTTNAFWTVFHGILGSGLERTTLTNPDTRKKINAIEHICAGGAIRGLQFLPTPHGLDVLTAAPDDIKQQGIAQGHQDQFIAEMAQWGMPRDRKFKVGGGDHTFEDFIRHAKMRASVKDKQELSWAIIIIAQYYGTDHAWTNAAGEKLTFDDVVRYERDASINDAACGGTHRLFGLTWAYHLHRKNGGKKTELWAGVAAKIDEHKQLARSFQSPDRTLSTDYFKGPDRKPDPHLRIGTTGHVVEWLALAMTDDELKSMWMQEAVNALAMTILDMRNDPVDSGALYHAAHGLQLYHDRVFGKPAAYLPLPPKR